MSFLFSFIIRLMRFYENIYLLKIVVTLIAAAVVIDGNMVTRNPTIDELNEFKYILNIHKSLVKYLGHELNDADYSTHDNTKLSQEELIPYTLKFVGLLSNENNPGWKPAVQHHFQNNKHHIEYWHFVGSPMPEEYLKEAVIDMMAAKFQYAVKQEVVELVRENSYEVNQEKLVQILHETMRKEKDFFKFDDHHIRLYSDDEKDFISKELKSHRLKCMSLYDVKEL